MQKMLNMSTMMPNKQVEISQTKYICIKLQSLKVYLYKKAKTSKICALLSQKRQLDLEFGAEFRCKVAAVCKFSTPKPTVYI